MNDKKTVNEMKTVDKMNYNENIKNNEDIKKEKENLVKTVDVVIPLYKPGNELIKIVDRLGRQTYPVNHIILINTECDEFDASKTAVYVSEIKTNKSTDSTHCTNNAIGNCASDVDDEKNNDTNIIIKNIKKSQFNHGLTRNLGMLMSDADYVVFMTQDAIPKNQNLIKELIKPFKDEDVYVTYARQMPRRECKYVEKYVRQFNYPDYDIVKTKETFEKYGIKNIFCSDVCAAYRRDKHVENGGFKKTDFSEDMIYAYDVIMEGKKVYYASNAKVVHSHNYSYMQQLKRNIEIGKSQKEYHYIFDNLKSENEGMKLLIGGIQYLIRNKKWYYVPDLIISTGFKFIGYRIGKHIN